MLECVTNLRTVVNGMYACIELMKIFALPIGSLIVCMCCTCFWVDAIRFNIKGTEQQASCTFDVALYVGLGLGMINECQTSTGLAFSLP